MLILDTFSITSDLGSLLITFENVPDEQYELKRRYVVSRLNVKKYFADAALTLKSDDQGEQPASSDCRVSARF